MPRKLTITQQAGVDLSAEREQYRASLPPDIEKIWEQSRERIGVVLSGGGARGAHEAGVLLAFQDAQLPTHIITAASIGSINAASYAAHSETLVGNAESLVESWSELTPATVGIDWFRYMLILAGTIITSAGFGNLIWQQLRINGIYFHLIHPRLTWFALGITGLAILFLYDQASYLGYVIKNEIGRRLWKPDRTKLIRSILANVVVWGCVVFFLIVAQLHIAADQVLTAEHPSTYLALSLLALIAALGYFFRNRISVFSHGFLRLPFRTGLFPNFERTRFLRDHIPVAGLRKSPIRVVMAAADVTAGVEKYFTNFTVEEIAADPGADPAFFSAESMPEKDDQLLLAIIASSAFPIVYEAVPLHGKLWTDGGIVSNQPIRPAIKLGADVLFLVMVEPRTQRRNEIKTFLDMGVRSIDMLMSQNLKRDLYTLNNVNGMCETYAEKLGLRPEQVLLKVGHRNYRYMKAFIVEPSETLAATVLDFDGRITAPAILQGYRDGCRAIHAYLEYLALLPNDMSKLDVKLVPEAMPAKVRVSGP